MDRVFVTGGAGYIGSATTRLLLDNGFAVTVFDNLETGHAEALPPDVDFIEGDLRDASQIREALMRVQPQAVLHFAAYALVGESMKAPERYWENNVAGGMNLLNAVVHAGVERLVFSSSCATYGTPERLPITEQTPQRPENPYGESKLMFEKALRWMDTCHGMTGIALRYFNACGADGDLGEDHSPESHLIPNVLKAALGQRDCVKIFGTDFPTPDGTCIRDYIHIKDLAAAHVLALQKGVSGAYNLGTGTGCSVREVIETARRITGRAISAVEEGRRPGDPAELVAAADKARRELGWVPEYSDLETILSDAWNWHRTHPHGYAPGGRVLCDC